MPDFIKKVASGMDQDPGGRSLKENRYAKSGRLLKTLEVKDIIRVQNRWVQNDVVFKDELKTGDGTEFIIRSIEFDAAIPDYLFTKASLRK